MAIIQQCFIYICEDSAYTVFLYIVLFVHRTERIALHVTLAEQMNGWANDKMRDSFREYICV